MTHRTLVGLLLLAALAASADAVELRNDGFEDGGQAGFQTGFATGEIAAVSLSSPCFNPVLERIRLLFGGQSGTRTVTLIVYDDLAGATNPGAPLSQDDYQLTASNSVFSEIDVSADAMSVPSRFRVGIRFQHDGAPSVARDADGTIAAARNFIFVAGMQQWFRSQTLGVTGDWIIRADVACGAVQFADGFE